MMISFHKANLDPQNFDLENIVRLLQTQGFVILAESAATPQIASDDPVIAAQHRLKILETKLGLSQLDISYADRQHYAERLSELGNYNIIGRPDRDVLNHHPAFDSNEAQGFHVDGVFKPLGYVKTVVMTCARAASSGGESHLFNAIGAIDSIKETHPHWIKAMQDPRAFRRRSTYSVKVGDHTDAMLGTLPETGEDAVRIAFDDSADISASQHHLPDAVDAYWGLKELSQSPSPFVVSFQLKPGETLIIDNTKVAHARSAFIDSAQAPRKIVRAKYLDRIVFTSKAECG